MKEAAPAEASIADARFDEVVGEVDASATGLDGPASRSTAPVMLPLVETTEHWLVRAGDGDQGAFAQVYDATAPCVFGLVLRILMDHTHAEEVTREVYLEAWRHAMHFDPERGAASAWLLQIAHSRSVNRVRTARARGTSGEGSGLAAQGSVPAP